jgi:hypothetical protein
MISVFIIIFYSFVDIVAGLLACAIVIFYYQSDYVESFSPSSSSSSLKEVVENEVIVIRVEEQEDIDNKFETVRDAYPLDPDVLILNDKDVNAFRQKHCVRGHLVHKGQIIKPEMGEHVFQEIEQDDYHKCNICDAECSFDLNLINIEDDLVNPKASNDLFEKVMINMKASQPK